MKVGHGFMKNELVTSVLLSVKLCVKGWVGPLLVQLKGMSFKTSPRREAPNGSSWHLTY